MRRIWCLVFLLASLPASVQAQGENAAETDISLITAADIAREKPAELNEMLGDRVGLDVNDSVITMRGVKGIAVFVNGFASSSAEFSRLRPEQVEKIEILRGAASARFGAEAMGGAIAITTRGTHRVHGSLTQGVDSRHGRFTRVSGRRITIGLGWSLLAEDKVDHGFRTVPDSPFPYQITVADERSKSQLIDGKLGWRGRDLEASLNLKRTDAWSFFGRPNWAFDWRTDNVRAQMTWRATDTLSLEASLGEERYETTGVRDRGTGTDAVGLAPETWLASSYRQRRGTFSSLARRCMERPHGHRSGRSRRDLANADYASRVESMAADSTIRKEALFASADLPLGAGRLELGLRRDLQRYVSSRVYDAGPPAQRREAEGCWSPPRARSSRLSWPLAAGTRLRGRSAPASLRRRRPNSTTAMSAPAT